MRIAVLADIHSNHIALDTCVKEALARDAEEFIFLGDYIGELACPQKTMESLRQIKESNRFLSCRMLNFDDKEKEMVVSLLKKYYNHVSSDFDIDKARQASEPEMPSLFGASEPEGAITREFLEANWVVSSYDEGEDCQMDYYMHELKCFPGEKAYCYSHEDDELRELEIVHVTARMDNAKLYDELVSDDDVLIKGEEEYGADCSAEFVGKFSCYLMWFKITD